jgi:hypothetical protein
MDQPKRALTMITSFTRNRPLVDYNHRWPETLVKGDKGDLERVASQ